ncbi:uncharacterized protein QC763_701090 [Podospora pseudopauciseta]|uniref:CBM1 domain-containing protein n=2 Tax=Podospora TaxID=5144 RepID=A0ABR0H321_9PEZI|nr:hypothetical protein QC763_701090 [Podospora pseudopauciseta]KAK4668967.1 hypothetical protein QC764_701090 [Podospora pseudoanserina]
MRVFSAVLLLTAGAAAQRGPYEQCGGTGRPDESCSAGWQCTTYNPYYAQCVPAATSAPAPTSTPAPSPTPVPSSSQLITSSSRVITTLTTVTTPPSITTSTQAGSGSGPVVPTPTTLQSGWYWIRAVATPNYRSYLQPQPTSTPVPRAAVLANSKTAAQFQLTSGQLIQNNFGNSPNLYLNVENPTDKTQRRLRTWFDTTPNTYGTFGWQGDTLTWTVSDINRPNSAAWLVCGDSKEVFINTGAFLWDTPAGCFDHTVIHSYNGAQADV